jgi:transposase
LAHDPDKTIIAKAKRCCHCAAELNDADHKLHSRHDKIEIPSIKPIVTRVERYAGHCQCCHGVTLAPVPEGLQEGSPFSPNILALALYHVVRHGRGTNVVTGVLNGHSQMLHAYEPLWY